MEGRLAPAFQSEGPRAVRARHIGVIAEQEILTLSPPSCEQNEVRATVYPPVEHPEEEAASAEARGAAGRVKVRIPSPAPNHALLLLQRSPPRRPSGRHPRRRPPTRLSPRPCARRRAGQRQGAQVRQLQGPEARTGQGRCRPRGEPC